MKSGPCISCPDGHRDKRRAECVNCQRRLAYVAGLGEMSHSVPVEFSDIGGATMTESQEPFTGGKICRDPRCDHAGEPQPVKNFYKMKNFVSANNPNGYDSTCKECRKRQQRDRRRKKDQPCGGGKLTKQKYFTLSFKDYPDLVEALEKLAAKEMRTLENQILYILYKTVILEKI